MSWAGSSPTGGAAEEDLQVPLPPPTSTADQACGAVTGALLLLPPAKRRQWRTVVPLLLATLMDYRPCAFLN
jgi:hypothetical protein